MKDEYPASFEEMHEQVVAFSEHAKALNDFAAAAVFRMDLVAHA